MRAARVIHTNYSLLWQHLSGSIVLPKLPFLGESQKEEVESYQERVTQNAVIINTLLGASVKHTPDGLLILCETLQTTPGREHIAQRILEGKVLFQSAYHLVKLQSQHFNGWLKIQSLWLPVRYNW